MYAALDKRIIITSVTKYVIMYKFAIRNYCNKKNVIILTFYLVFENVPNNESFFFTLVLLCVATVLLIGVHGVSDL